MTTDFVVAVGNRPRCHRGRRAGRARSWATALVPDRAAGWSTDQRIGRRRRRVANQSQHQSHWHRRGHGRSAGPGVSCHLQPVLADPSAALARGRNCAARLRQQGRRCHARRSSARRNAACQPAITTVQRTGPPGNSAGSRTDRRQVATAAAEIWPLSEYTCAALIRNMLGTAASIGTVRCRICPGQACKFVRLQWRRAEPCPILPMGPTKTSWAGPERRSLRMGAPRQPASWPLNGPISGMWRWLCAPHPDAHGSELPGQTARWPTPGRAAVSAPGTSGGGTSSVTGGCDHHSQGSGSMKHAPARLLAGHLVLAPGHRLTRLPSGPPLLHWSRHISICSPADRGTLRPAGDNPALHSRGPTPGPGFIESAAADLGVRREQNGSSEAPPDVVRCGDPQPGNAVTSGDVG